MADLSMALSGAIILAVVLTGASGLQCYECKIVADPGQRPNQTRLCIHFDYSQRFVVECPYSTMCRKKSFYLDIQNGGRITGVERDCAPQKHVYMEYKDEQWREETEVLEAYTEGCHSLDDKGERTPHTEYCYCRSHLCNAGATNTNVDSYHTDAMAVIVIFNLMKYIRSLR